MYYICNTQTNKQTNKTMKYKVIINELTGRVYDFKEIKEALSFARYWDENVVKIY